MPIKPDTNQPDSAALSRFPSESSALIPPQEVFIALNVAACTNCLSMDRVGFGVETSLLSVDISSPAALCFLGNCVYSKVAPASPGLKFEFSDWNLSWFILLLPSQ